jgi:hypothetical protein
MIFEILSSAVILYFCYKLVIYRRRKTRQFREKLRDKNKTKS